MSDTLAVHPDIRITLADARDFAQAAIDDLDRNDLEAAGYAADNAAGHARTARRLLSQSSVSTATSEPTTTVPPLTRSDATQLAHLALADATNWIRDTTDALEQDNIGQAVHACNAATEHATDALQQLIELLVWDDD
jgi:hypothetical protein